MPQVPNITLTAGGPSLGTYANDVNVSNSPWDFVFDFAQLVGAPRVAPPAEGEDAEVLKHVVGRFVMSPQHTKAFLQVLAENIARYEAQWGDIPDVLARARQDAEQGKGGSNA
jgi:hypothetical protein